MSDQANTGHEVPSSLLFGIRPLKWKENGRTSSWQGWYSSTPFATYTIDRWKESGSRWSDWSAEVSIDGARRDVVMGCKSVSSARLACNEHWRKMLLPVLVPNTVLSVAGEQKGQR